MSSSYSSSLRIELIGSGDQAGAWGATTDSNFAYVMDTAIAGYQAVAVSSTAQALTYVNGPSSTANLNQSVYAMLKFNTAGAASAIYAPPVSKQYIIWNNSGYTITIYNSSVIGNTTAAGTGVAIPNGSKLIVWSDATNFYDVQASNLTSTLPIANGGTGQTTANAAFNALAPSQTSASGKYLKSDGTNTSWDQIDISTGDITGTLPVANGGTGVTTSTGTGAVVLSTSPALTTPTLTSARVPGSSTGYTTISSANTSATNYTVTLPAENFTVGFRNVPAVGTKTSSYTLATGDVGKYVQVGSGGSIVIPDSVFSEGDVVSIFNNTSSGITITCTINTAYIAGINADAATMTLVTRGVATVLFISGTVCVVSGLVS
jgi:hypothetical protein